jgi:hypothetical protein
MEYRTACPACGYRINALNIAGRYGGGFRPGGTICPRCRETFRFSGSAQAVFLSTALGTLLLLVVAFEKSGIVKNGGLFALSRYRLEIRGDEIVFDSPWLGHHVIPLKTIVAENFAVGGDSTRPFVRYDIEYTKGSDRRTLSTPWKIFQIKKAREFDRTLRSMLN